jgi:SAP domain
LEQPQTLVEVQVQGTQQTDFRVLEEAEISSFKVVQLRAELEKRGVSGLGNKKKAWLQNRLRQYFPYQLLLVIQTIMLTVT